MQFYERLLTMYRNMLRKRIFEYFKRKKTGLKWFREVKIGLAKVGLIEDTTNTDVFRQVKEFKNFWDTG